MPWCTAAVLRAAFPTVTAGTLEHGLRAVRRLRGREGALPVGQHAADAAAGRARRRLPARCAPGRGARAVRGHPHRPGPGTPLRRRGRRRRRRWRARGVRCRDRPGTGLVQQGVAPPRPAVAPRRACSACTSFALGFGPREARLAAPGTAGPAGTVASTEGPAPHGRGMAADTETARSSRPGGVRAPDRGMPAAPLEQDVFTQEDWVHD